MAKLSQQFAETGEERLSRTERVKEKQSQQRYLLEQSREKARFEAKQQMAEELQERDFADIKDLKEYEEKYQALDPTIKPFFATPESLTQAQTERITTTKSQVQEKIAWASKEEQEAKAKRDAKYQRNQEYFNRSTRADRQELKTRNDLRAEKEFEMRAAYLRGYKEGLGKGMGELNQGKDISIADIKGHASEIGQFERAREQASLEEHEFKREKAEEIKELQAQGYKPFVIEKSYKGKTQEAYLTFQKDGDWKKVATFQAPKQISTTGLEKSKLGRVQVERSLFVGGQEFKFKSHLQLYKDPTGKLSTQYGSIGKDENVIIKEAQDNAFKDWKKTQKDKPIDVPIKILTAGKELPFGYGGQQTITDKPITQLITKEDYYAQQDKSVFSKPLASIKKVWEKIPTGRWHYTAPKLFGLNIGTGLQPFKTSERSIDVTAQVEKGSEKLGDVSSNIKDWAFGSKGREKIKQLDIDLETKYQEKYQSTFERKYMKGLIYEETTFKKATKSFEESKEAKILQKEYQEEYITKYEKISSDVPILRASTGGLAMAGLSLGQLGLKAIKTPKSTVTSAALVYGGVKTLQAIPTGVTYAGTTGFGIYGTYKVVSPTSTIEERGSGLMTALLSGAFLGRGIYKDLKSPVVKSVKVKPKISTKIARPVGFEQRPMIKTDIYGKVTKIETTIYPKTLSRQVIEGRKTIVTTKGSELLSKYTKIKLDPIYKGVPTQDPKGYQQASKLLSKYGYTPSQAKSTLRYHAPRVIDTEMKSINVLYSGSAVKTPFAETKTTVITKQPKIEFNAGLKTRGARSIKDVYQSEKILLGSYKDFSIIKEASIRTTGYVTDKGSWYNKIIQAGKTTTQYERNILAKAGEIKKSQVIVGGQKDLKLLISKDYRYQNLKELFQQKQIVPKQLKNLYGKQEAKLIKTAQDPIYIDERELTGISAKKIPIKKPTPKIRTIEEMSAKELKEMVRDLQKIYGKGKPTPKITKQQLPKGELAKKISELPDEFFSRKNLELLSKGKVPKLKEKILEKQKPAIVFDKVEDAAIKSSTSARDQVSKFYGTGQYERTGGGLSPQELRMGTDLQQLKTFQTPDLKLQSQVKEIIQIKKLDTLIKFKMGSLVGIKTLTDFKTDSKFKTDLKIKTDLKSLIKTQSLIKSQQKIQFKQPTALKTILKSKLDLRSPTTSLLTPPMPKIKIPTITPPPFKPIPFYWPTPKKKVKDKLLQKQLQGQEFAFLPDFTSRALGLDPEILTGKQAQARIKKILTGLEIRRPIKIR